MRNIYLSKIYWSSTFTEYPIFKNRPRKFSTPKGNLPQIPIVLKTILYVNDLIIQGVSKL